MTKAKGNKERRQRVVRGVSFRPTEPERLTAVALRLGTTRSGLIRQAIQDVLSRYEARPAEEEEQMSV